MNVRWKHGKTFFFKWHPPLGNYNACFVLCFLCLFFLSEYPCAFCDWSRVLHAFREDQRQFSLSVPDGGWWKGHHRILQVSFSPWLEYIWVDRHKPVCVHMDMHINLHSLYANIHPSVSQLYLWLAAVCWVFRLRYFLVWGWSCLEVLGTDMELCLQKICSAIELQFLCC